MPKNILNIKIPLQGVFDEFKLDTTQVEDMREILKSVVVTEIHRNWQDAAKQGLNQTRNTYLRNLVIVDTGKFSGAIVLTGILPNMIEQGASAFDMKQGFMKSIKVKYNKNGGWYLTIPFRFATPNAGGFSSVFSGVLPVEIYNLVKGGGGKKTQPFTGNVPSQTTRLKQSQIPEPFSIPKTRERVIADTVKTVWDEYKNKFSIYAGLQRDEKFYENATQSTYNTFRRVGANSDPLAFIHTGITARNFAEKALANTDLNTIVDNTVDKLLNDWGFGS